MITFVCGQLCSGKTLYSQALTKLVSGVYIEVGDIVREIKQTEERKELQNSAMLCEKIVEELIKKTPLSYQKHYVISGVRQKEILEFFPEATIIWIECPKKERKNRYKERARDGDAIPFKEAEQGDINLGILEVKKYILKV